MGAQSHVEHQAKVTITYSYDERLYIKMLAEKAHMNLSEFILSYLRKDFPVNKKTPNKKTLAAVQAYPSALQYASDRLQKSLMPSFQDSM